MELIYTASSEFERVVRQLPDDSWGLPTPSDVTVRELVDHVVTGNRFTAMLLAGVNRDEARRKIAADQVAGDMVAAVVESAQEQVSAFRLTPADQLVPGPQGEVSAAAFLRFRLVDLVVHAWDLLRAAGLDETLDPHLVTCLLMVIEPHLGEMLATGAYGPGPSGSLAPDATLQARLLDSFGRRP